MTPRIEAVVGIVIDGKKRREERTRDALGGVGGAWCR